ncbi:putative uncharacterized protein C1orf196 [Thamnophis elegans]|uniref:putative uncharacterized protein C1orf196 n=1 Tax=Thamnophis elegans TaxID=35005 RepID=UPI0013779E5E|nr:putative uncharacterized protein C1orf196 [Thamnophis elegans]
MEASSVDTTSPVTFSQVFGHQCQLLEAAVQSLRTLNDQISDFIVHKAQALEEDDGSLQAFLPAESGTLRRSMSLMTQLLMDAQLSKFPAAVLNLLRSPWDKY